MIRNNQSLLFLAAFYLVLISVASCRKTNNSSPQISGDYMIVGSAGGFTAPAAKTTFYLLHNGQLWSDTTVSSGNPPTEVSKFQFNVLHPAAGYDSVKNVLHQVPVELLSRNGQSIGGIFPDAGYLDVITVINGICYNWNFQADQSGSSLPVQAFVDSLQRIR